MRNQQVTTKVIGTGGEIEDHPMKSDYIAAAILVMVAVAIGAGMNAVHPSSDYCPSPSPASVEALFAPCAAFDTAMGHSPGPATRLAAR
jgi:hypothetical protein